MGGGVGMDRRAEAWASIFARGGSLAAEAPEPEPEPEHHHAARGLRRVMAWCLCFPAAVVLVCSLVAVAVARWAEEWCEFVEAVCRPEWPADRQTWWERAAGWLLGDGGADNGEAEDK